MLAECSELMHVSMISMKWMPSSLSKKQKEKTSTVTQLMDAILVAPDGKRQVISKIAIVTSVAFQTVRIA